MIAPMSGMKRMRIVQPAFANPWWSRRRKLSTKHQMMKKRTRKIPANIRNVQNKLNKGHVYANIGAPPEPKLSLTDVAAVDACVAAGIGADHPRARRAPGVPFAPAPSAAWERNGGGCDRDQSSPERVGRRLRGVRVGERVVLAGLRGPH